MPSRSPQWGQSRPLGWTNPSRAWKQSFASPKSILGKSMVRSNRGYAKPPIGNRLRRSKADTDSARFKKKISLTTEAQRAPRRTRQRRGDHERRKEGNVESHG